MSSAVINLLDDGDSSDDEIPASSGFTNTKTDARKGQSSSTTPKRSFGTITQRNSDTSTTTTAITSTSNNKVLVPSAVPNHRGIISQMKKKTSNQQPPPKKKAKITITKPSKAFSLIWVCTHGKGRRSSWRKKDLKIVGVYPSKDAAEQAKRDVMSQYDNCGHGDILVGGCWDDEIDLVIREAPMHF